MFIVLYSSTLSADVIVEAAIAVAAHAHVAAHAPHLTARICDE
jgi:hypothetical protein